MVIRMKLLDLMADVLFPDYNACHLCGRFPEREGILCQSCWKALKAAQYKKLHVASPEPHAPLTACYAAFPHSGEARELVHLLKYQSDCAAADWLADAMTAALSLSPLASAWPDAVIPVPLHSSRLEQRGYNQALLLAQGVCQRTGLPLVQDALIRVHATDTQLHRDHAERINAMKGAFAVVNTAAIRRQRILLVDDVLTTGATAMSCAETLMAAGAESVSLLTVCRA